MKFYNLGSSSAGNCYVMEFELGNGKNPFRLMVEAGFPYQSIVARMTKAGLKISDLGGLLITHSHQDHGQGARGLAMRGVQVYATEGTLKSIGLSGQGWPMRYGTPTPIAEGVKALAFKVDHDADEPAGFVIKTKTETAIFAIDAREWMDNITAIEPDYLFVEANYDQRLMAKEQFSLQKRANLKDIQRYRLNERIKRSHMSIEACLCNLKSISKRKLKATFLMHLSDRMSAPSLWKEQVIAITGAPCYVCRKDGGIE